MSPRFGRFAAIARISAPIYVAQIAVMANAVADTIITGHYNANHLAAIGLGAAIWASVFIPMMGVILGLSPIIARHFGANEPEAIGRELRAGIWVGMALAVPMMLLFTFPDAVLRWAQVPETVLPLSRRYLQWLACGVPALMVARVFYAFAPAVGHPRAVMAINVAALCVKIPLSYGFVHGAWGLPELGGPGCGLASAIGFWLMLAIITGLLRFDRSYRRFAIWGQSWRFDPPAVWRILRLGGPISGSIFIEVTSFVLMALFLARLGATVSGAQQIVSNFAALLFMLPLALGIGTQVLIGQAIGAKRPDEARRAALDGLRLSVGFGTIVSIGVWLARDQIIRMYTGDPAVATIVFELFPLLVVFHWFDALQCSASQALRGYQQTWVPMLIYGVSLWGIGVGVGYAQAFALWPDGSPITWLTPMGPRGFWTAQTASLVVAGAALLWEFNRISRPAAR
ncbi:MAG: MATE family efflux transporter [Betaproteobacteria bacterium]